MTALQGEELEQFLEGVAESYKQDTEWLRSRGWLETDDTFSDNPDKKAGPTAKVWVSPTGERAAHCASIVGFHGISQAIDVAHGDLLEELGWGDVTVHQFYPQYENGDGTVSGYEEEHPPYVHYAHPVSGRLYMFLEAVDIARFYNNNEAEYYAAGYQNCGKTQELQRQLGDRKLKKGDEIHIKFVEGEDKHFHWILQ